jgi:carbonic anhydrase
VAVVDDDPDEDPPIPAADEVLKQLMAGNRRFMEQHLRHPHQTGHRRAAVETMQHPVAAILSCSDSRVPPEIVFDRGIGDLFVIREAGHVADNATLGSLEYAAEHLHIPLIMVLGHERCGAVSAAVETVKSGKPPHGHIANLVADIRPAVEVALKAGGDIVDAAVRANIRLCVDQIMKSKPILAELVDGHKLKVVGARYDLHTGKVELF